MTATIIKQIQSKCLATYDRIRKKAMVPIQRRLDDLVQ